MANLTPPPIRDPSDTQRWIDWYVRINQILQDLEDGILDAVDSDFTIKDNTDNSKVAAFQASGISTSTTRTFTFPDASGIFVLRDDTATLTNKTIDGDNNTVSNLAHGAEVDNPTSGVHGATGTIVGTTDSQTLTNKTIDGDNNTISNLAHGAEVDEPSSGVHGVTGSVVGTTDSQTLTNKTISAANNTLTGVAKLATGTYTGDGSTSQALTGLGFAPTFVKIWERQTADATSTFVAEVTDTIIDDNASGMAIEILTQTLGGAGTGGTSRINAVISLDADGFTVDDAGTDAHPNQNTIVYNFLALGID
jgi:hypothetical protein